VCATFLVSALALAATTLGHGPFVRERLNESLFVLQGFMAVIALTMLMLAAAIAERDAAKRAAERSAEVSEFLAKAGQVLGSSIDYQNTLQSVARLAVPTLGDTCIVYIAEDDGSIHRVAAAASDPSKEPPLQKLRTFPLGPKGRSVVGEVLKTGKMLFIPRFTEDDLRSLSAGGESAAIIQQIAPRSSVTVPLSARNRVIGAITFAMAESERSYSQWDFALAEELGRRAGLAVDNARLYKDAQLAVRARDEFLSVASHELRTPLTSLELQVATLERAAVNGHSVPAEKFSVKLEAITRQLGRLTRLVENLLDVSRVSSGRLALEVETVDLGQVVHDVVARFRDQLIRADCQLSVDVEERCDGQWDRMRLEQMVTNLLSNAIKYGPGKPIEIRLKSHGDSCELIVQDAGIGIAVEDQVRIFERFERAGSHRQFGGLGLGLWIVNQIVQAMGGNISVTSHLGAGSQFAVSLPRNLTLPQAEGGSAGSLNVS
jgi:signal transduction histidine kinase